MQRAASALALASLDVVRRRALLVLASLAWVAAACPASATLITWEFQGVVRFVQLVNATPELEQAVSADQNGDGIVNLLDTVILRRTLAGEPTTVLP